MTRSSPFNNILKGIFGMLLFNSFLVAFYCTPHYPHGDDGWVLFSPSDPAALDPDHDRNTTIEGSVSNADVKSKRKNISVFYNLFVKNKKSLTKSQAIFNEQYSSIGVKGSMKELHQEIKLGRSLLLTNLMVKTVLIKWW